MCKIIIQRRKPLRPPAAIIISDDKVNSKKYYAALKESRKNEHFCTSACVFIVHINMCVCERVTHIVARLSNPNPSSRAHLSRAVDR